MAMRNKTTFDPVRLEVFKHLFSAIADEMGVLLRRTSYSPNIKERRDFSCAIFNSQGQMIAQAAHIPVHLGSMSMAVTSIIQTYFTENPLQPEDTIILNDPYLGGTHLPDITLVTPVFVTKNTVGHKPLELIGFVASRAHHADIGGISPGSMSVASEIYQEGLIIPPIKIISNGQINQDILAFILANVRTPQERYGDLHAQIAANQRGVHRLQELISRYGLSEITTYMKALISYSEQMTRRLLDEIPDGTYTFSDILDNDGISPNPVQIKASITIQGDHAIVDFTGSAPQQKGGINAVYAITLSAVYYVFRCLLGLDVPNNSGCLIPIKIIAPEGSVVNARKPAPVVGGNVETSQRIVDVLLGALHQACPDRIPAASQGTMNNLTIGGWDEEHDCSFAYYETIGGGMGARPNSDGPSAVHSHLTNTLNTPIEAIEYNYPLRVTRYEINRGTGGSGEYKGGDGIRRDIQALVDVTVSILSDRRDTSPYGLAGGQPGKNGANILIHEGAEIALPGKGTIELHKGDIISIRTPGGGGFGEKK